MDENAKAIQREIAKDKIQVILASIALAVLIIMEFYIMINFRSNFIAMAIGILLMIVALFFLISALMDMSLKQKDIENEKYEEIYNAQKASYLVIKKSFDEMEQRLRAIEANSSLPAEDIINAQKAVAKVTISRSKENTDALMNSNDELINQIVNIKEIIDSNNNQILEKQQSLLKESNFDIQQKISELTSQISIIEGKIQNGIPVMAAQPIQPIQMVPPQMQAMAPEPQVAPVESVTETLMEEPVMEELPVEEAVAEEPVMEELPAEEAVAEEPVMEELPAEEPVAEEPVMEELPAEEPVAEEPVMEELPAEEPVAEEPVMEELPAEEPVAEEPVMEELPVEETSVEEVPAEEVVDDLGLDLDAVVEEESGADDLGLDLDAIVEEPTEELPVEEVEEEIVEDLGLDLDSATEEVMMEEPIVEEAPPEEIVAEEPTAGEAPAEEIVAEEPVAEEAPAEEIITEEPVADDPGSNLDALLEEIGETVEEPEPEPEPEPEAPPEEPKDDSIVIPDVGVDLTDPNRVMSPEEIEKLFANI
ncbi:hypothetical protein SAMN04487830_10947 [Pseudobutyrivibrio sp. OR37]|uniref:hypothetical protein n=1 Tax=Pseudobutyrivibrio sp. OR37 TaxID=1798186 RepID=UPI0008E9210E|nr:hypothetical protein [Pseudobutyrivibrio sp. OR37]SFH81667.1 hypothetical protein SAMN04487830_10947 [Pseudobutyrivibrio sp. OR37]